VLFYFFYLWLRRLKYKYGFDISYRTTIGKGLYIGHSGGIVIHGDKDPTVPVSESRKMVKAGEALGIKIKYIEVPGGDHSNIAVPNFNNIFDWFDAHKRQPKNAAKAAGGSQ
jgi:hypothetical protein